MRRLQRMLSLEKVFLTLGIESSCDDTSVALLAGPRRILSWKISSQIERHAAFGGVVPEYASRMHLEAILPLTQTVLEEAGVADPAKQIGLVAVTRGPGLMGSLLVGVMTAKAYAQAWNVPVLGVNHLEGHIYANVVDHEDLQFPFLCMVVSGGHTEIVLVRGCGESAPRRTTRPARPSTKWPRCSACPIPAARSSTVWPLRATRTRSVFPTWCTIWTG